MSVFFVTIFGQKFRQKKEQNPFTFPFSVLHLLSLSHFLVPGSSTAESYAYKNAKLKLFRRRFLYASIRWARAIAPRTWNNHATRHPFFDFSAIQSPAFPDAFFMAAKPKSTYDGISLFDVWKFLKFRNIL